MGKPLLDHLQHLFPALDGTLDLGGLHEGPPEETYADIRTANQRSAQESDGDGLSSHAWKKLDRIICDGTMLYVLGLRSPIRVAIIFLGQVDYHHYTANALRENPVPHLHLSTLDHNLSMFGALFSPELAGTLTHLTLCLLYSNYYGFANSDTDAAPQLRWDDILGTIVAAIRPLHKLTHLRIIIGASVYIHEYASWPFAPWGEYAHSFRWSSFDFAGTAAALALALPSVQYVFLTTSGFLANWAESDDPDDVGFWKPYERWYVDRGWRVAKFGGAGAGASEEGGQSLVELHDDVAEWIMRKEELVIAEKDMGPLHLKYGWHGVAPPPLSVP